MTFGVKGFDSPLVRKVPMSDEHVTRTWTVENTWICTSCKAENLGRDLKCQKCSSPREVDESDLVPDADKAPAVTDPELLKMAAQGENWVCEFCGSQARDLQGKCSNCAAKKASAAKCPRCGKETDKLYTSPAGDVCFECVSAQANESIEKSLGLSDAQPAPSVAKQSEDFKLPFDYARVMVIGGGALAVLLVLFLAFHSTQLKTKVARIHWTYHVQLEQRFTRSGEGWGAPAGSFNTTCEIQQHGTHNCNAYQCNPYDHPYDCRPHDCHPHKKPYDCRPHSCNAHTVQVSCGTYDCKCHKSCKSKKYGFSECSESCSTCTKYCPKTVSDTCYDTCNETIYDTCHDTCHETLYNTCYQQCPTMEQYCHYSYYEWVNGKADTTEGDDHLERWPDLVAVGEEQRLQRSQEYYVDFFGEDRLYSYKPDSADEFDKFNVGDLWKIDVPMIGFAKPIERSH